MTRKEQYKIHILCTTRLPYNNNKKENNKQTHWSNSIIHENVYLIITAVKVTEPHEKHKQIAPAKKTRGLQKKASYRFSVLFSF